VRLGEVKRSIAAMASRWFCGKTRQRWAGSGCFGARHPTRDGSLGNIEAKLEQFTMDAWSAPGGILGDHAEN